MDIAPILSATEDLITPVGVLDDEVVERNLTRMAKIAADHRVHLRPHAKTHKNGEMARRQLAHGAVGMTCATMTEAEVFTQAGVDDLLIAHPPVGEPKLRQLAAITDRVKRLVVSLDSVEIARLLPPSIDIYWEVDSGQHRIGTPAGEPTVNAVKELVRTIGTARFRGLITHAGHSYAATNLAERQQAADQETDGLLLTTALLGDDGIEVRELSIGSTPTAGLARNLPALAREDRGGGITEMRPGTYIYGDANQVALGSQRIEDCALAVVATVVSTPARDRAVVDAGSKALSADLRVGPLKGYGIVVGREDLTIEKLSEEHAVITAAQATRLAIGDRLVIVPSHACTVVNLHPALLLISKKDQPRWLPCEARGWSSESRLSA